MRRSGKEIYLVNKRFKDYSSIVPLAIPAPVLVSWAELVSVCPVALASVTRPWPLVPAQPLASVVDGRGTTAPPPFVRPPLGSFVSG